MGATARTPGTFPGAGEQHRAMPRAVSPAAPGGWAGRERAGLWHPWLVSRGNAD